MTAHPWQVATKAAGLTMDTAMPASRRSAAITEALSARVRQSNSTNPANLHAARGANTSDDARGGRRQQVSGQVLHSALPPCIAEVGAVNAAKTG
jgi:hypothetical protein